MLIYITTATNHTLTQYPKSLYQDPNSPHFFLEKTAKIFLGYKQVPEIEVILKRCRQAGKKRTKAIKDGREDPKEDEGCQWSKKRGAVGWSGQQVY